MARTLKNIFEARRAMRREYEGSRAFCALNLEVYTEWFGGMMDSEVDLVGDLYCDNRGAFTEAFGVSDFSWQMSDRRLLQVWKFDIPEEDCAIYAFTGEEGTSFEVAGDRSQVDLGCVLITLLTEVIVPAVRRK